MAVISPGNLVSGPNQFESNQAQFSLTAARAQGLIESLAGSFQSNAPVNLVPNPLATGAVVGTAGGGAGTLSGTFPTGAHIGGNQGNLVAYIAAIGIDANGHSFWDLNLSGTTSTTAITIALAGNGGVAVSGVPITAASYTFGLEASFSAGSLTNITGADLELDAYTSASAFVNTPFFSAITLTGTPTTFSFAGTANATSVWGVPSLVLTFSSGVAINVRLRIANPQVMLTSTSTAYTAVFADRGTTKKINSPATFTVTIPNGIFLGGQVLYYRQLGVGAVSLVSDGTTVLVSGTGTFATRAPGSLIMTTADMDVPNLWWVDGDLA
jgi:hypothetical protein